MFSCLIMMSLFQDATLVEGLLVFCGVAVVFRQGLGKIMVAREILFGTKEIVIVILGVEHGFDGGRGRDADGAWRQSGVFVCVVR